jgi:uncharacterized membrane protein
MPRLFAGAVATAAMLALAVPPASAAEPCGDIHIGSCYVQDPDGSYTCTVGHVGFGNTVSVCLIEWQP